MPRGFVKTSLLENASNNSSGYKFPVRVSKPRTIDESSPYGSNNVTLKN